MNVFKILDEFVGGAIQFILSFAVTLLRLIVQPFSGATKLYNAYCAHSTQQISPPSFLAISILFGTLLGARFMEPTRTQLPGFGDLAMFLASGSLSSDFVKLLAATVFATVMIDLLLKLIGMVRLSKQRAARFVGTLEYEFGFVVIWISTFFSFTGENAAENISMILLFYVPLMPAAAIFWAQIRRDPRWLRRARKMKQFIRRLRKLPAREGRRERWQGLARRATETVLGWRLEAVAKFVVFGYFRLLLWFIAIFPLVFIVAAGLGASRAAAEWLVEQERPRAHVELLALRCDLGVRPIVVRAVAWNDSEVPAVDMVQAKRLKIFNKDLADDEVPLRWKLSAKSREGTEILKPGDAVKVEGTALPETSYQPNRRWDALSDECGSD